MVKLTIFELHQTSANRTRQPTPQQQAKAKRKKKKKKSKKIHVALFFPSFFASSSAAIRCASNQTHTHNAKRANEKERKNLQIKLKVFWWAND
jgi:hypothetical protein